MYRPGGVDNNSFELDSKTICIQCTGAQFLAMHRLESLHRVHLSFRESVVLVPELGYWVRSHHAYPWGKVLHIAHASSKAP